MLAGTYSPFFKFIPVNSNPPTFFSCMIPRSGFDSSCQFPSSAAWGLDLDGSVHILFLQFVAGHSYLAASQRVELFCSSEVDGWIGGKYLQRGYQHPEWWICLWMRRTWVLIRIYTEVRHQFEVDLVLMCGHLRDEARKQQVIEKFQIGPDDAVSSVSRERHVPSYTSAQLHISFCGALKCLGRRPTAYGCC